MGGRQRLPDHVGSDKNDVHFQLREHLTSFANWIFPFEKLLSGSSQCRKILRACGSVRTMSSDGALKLPHPEVKRLRGSLDSGLLLMHPQLGPIRGEEIVRDRELWICDYRLGFPTFSPVVVDPHFVRRSGRLVRPKSGIPLCELQLMWDCWDC